MDQTKLKNSPTLKKLRSLKRRKINIRDMLDINLNDYED